MSMQPMDCCLDRTRSFGREHEFAGSDLTTTPRTGSYGVLHKDFDVGEEPSQVTLTIGRRSAPGALSGTTGTAGWTGASRT